MNELLHTQLNIVNEEVDRLLLTSPLVIRKYTEHLSHAKGKGIRALSVLVSAMDENNKMHQDAYKLAASIEILHLATLVHDDVMDDASSRRGIPTLHSLYGRRTAVIVGDYLLALAMNELSNLEEAAKYVEFGMSEIILDVALGELKQHINNGNQDLSLKDYMDIIRGKTAKLFEASFFAGAMTLTDDEETLNKYKEMGDLVGMMFQINDDCLDFEDDELKALKPVQSDYEQGVMTLPLLHVFEQEPSLRQEKLNRNLINELVKKFDGVGFAKRKANKYYEQAINILDSLDINETKKSSLKFVIDKANNIL